MDKLTQLYETWQKTVEEDPTTFQAFQGGVSASAVSMRTRALAAVDKATTGLPNANALRNQIKNAIGSLPDIPE